MDFNQPPQLFVSWKVMKAKTAEELSKKMLQLQVTMRKPAKFSVPQFVKGQYETWYLYDYSKDIKGLEQFDLEFNNKG